MTETYVDRPTYKLRWAEPGEFNKHHWHDIVQLVIDRWSNTPIDHPYLTYLRLPLHWSSQPLLSDTNYRRDMDDRLSLEERAEHDAVVSNKLKIQKYRERELSRIMNGFASDWFHLFLKNPLMLLPAQTHEIEVDGEKITWESQESYILSFPLVSGNSSQSLMSVPDSSSVMKMLIQQSELEETKFYTFPKAPVMKVIK